MHLDYTKMANHVAKAESRALGLIIAKTNPLVGSLSHRFKSSLTVWFGVSSAMEKPFGETGNPPPLIQYN